LEICDKYTDPTIQDIRDADNSSTMPSFMCRWNVESMLGRGSFGAVYEISKLAATASKPSALKVICVDGGNNNDFEKEVQILQSLDSRYLTRIEDFDEVTTADGKRSYLLIRMELLHKLPRETMSVPEVIRMGKQICAALTECHNSNPVIIHRDIKPDNIMVADSGIYKLGDFGSSRVVDKNQAMTSIGTPYYMPPEIAAYQPYDHRADIYSLGITMYVLLNKGKQPFSEGGDRDQAIRRRLSGELLPEIPGCPPLLINLLRRATAKDPKYRFESAAEFSRALDSVLIAPSAASLPVQPVTRAVPSPSPAPAPAPVVTQQPVRTNYSAPVTPPAGGANYSNTTNPYNTTGYPNMTGQQPANQFNLQNYIPLEKFPVLSAALSGAGLFFVLISLITLSAGLSVFGLILAVPGLIFALNAKKNGLLSTATKSAMIMAGITFFLFFISIIVI